MSISAAYAGKRAGALGIFLPYLYLAQNIHLACCNLSDNMKKHQLILWRAMPIIVGGILTVIVVWFLLDAFLHFRKEPIMLAIPVSCDNLDDSHIPFSVPRGRYYMQIAFEEESLSSFYDSRISGLIILDTGKDQYLAGMLR